MPSIHFSVSSPPFVAFLLIAAGILAAFFFYRYTIPAVSRGLRILLTILRSASLTLLLLIILEPRMTLVRSWMQPPSLAILADNSRSMQISDGTSLRSGRERSILRSASLRPHSVSADVQYFSFGSRLRHIPEDDTLSFNEDATNISSALRDIGRMRDADRPSAIVMLSDGDYNAGANPMYEADELGIPVFTVGIGDSTEKKDILIARTAYNDIVYSGVPAPVNVTVRSSGFGGEKVEVELKDGTTVVDHASLELAPGIHEYDVPLTFVPGNAGTRKYTVTVSTLPGEVTALNNTRSFFVRVLKSKLSIVLIAGFPNTDLSAIRQTLHEEKNFNVASFTQKPGGGFYEGALGQSMLDTADCIVLIDMPTVSTPEQTTALLRHTVETRNTPFLFIAGKDVSTPGMSSSPFSSYLPFTADGPVSGERLVFFSPALSQRLNPILNSGTPDRIDAWSGLPPVYLAPFRFRARAESVVLGTAKEQNVDTGIPFVLTRSSGRHKSLAVMGYGLWRWRLMAQDSKETSDLLPGFLSAAIQWLTSPEENKQVRITPSKQIFTQNEPVEFTGQVYDANARPVDNARMTLMVKSGERIFETNLKPLGEGRYAGSLEGLGEGDYRVRAEADVDGSTIGSDSSRFSVGALDLEFQDTRMNPEMLRAIAFRTGGMFFTPDDITQLGAALDSVRGFAPKEMRSTSEIEVWNWKGSLILILLLLAIEWVIRKRNGML